MFVVKESSLTTNTQKLFEKRKQYQQYQLLMLIAKERDKYKPLELRKLFQFPHSWASWLYDSLRRRRSEDPFSVSQTCHNRIRDSKQSSSLISMQRMILSTVGIINLNRGQLTILTWFCLRPWELLAKPREPPTAAATQCWLHRNEITVQYDFRLS